MILQIVVFWLWCWEGNIWWDITWRQMTLWCSGKVEESGGECTLQYSIIQNISRVRSHIKILFMKTKSVWSSCGPTFSYNADVSIFQSCTRSWENVRKALPAVERQWTEVEGHLVLILWFLGPLACFLTRFGAFQWKLPFETQFSLFNKFTKCIYSKVFFPKCIFSKCIYPKCISAKCTRLACLLSFASLFSCNCCDYKIFTTCNTTSEERIQNISIF